MIAEKPVEPTTVDLRRLKRRVLWLPTLAVAAILLLDGLFDYYLEEAWANYALSAHFLFMGLVSVGTFLFVRPIFNIVQQGQAEILARSAALVSLQRRFRALIENSSDLILLLNASGVIGYASPSVTRLLGYAPRDLVDRVLFDLIHCEERDDTRTRFLELGQQTTGILTGALRAQHTDGSWRWLGFVANNLLADPSVGAIVCNARDVTTRKHAEEALQSAHDALEQKVAERTSELARANQALHVEVSERRRAEAELQSLFDGVPVGLYRTTPGGQILRGNRALIQTLGCSDAETLLTANAWDLYVDPDARAQWMARMDRDGAVWNFEVELHRFDGRRIWVRLSARTIRGVDGAILHYDGVVEDITKRKWADVALRESQARLEGIVGSVMDGIVTIDADHQIAFFNTAAEAIFRCAAVHAVGQPVAHFIPEWEQSGSPTFARAFDDIVGLRGRQAIRKEVIGLRGQDEEFPCEVSISRVANYPQRLYTMVVRDIAERKRAMCELEKSREMLRDLAAHLQSVREEERCTIAREIHDELGQALTGLKIDLAWLAPRLPAEPTALGGRVKDMLRLIDGTVQAVRRMATQLRPGILDDLGLVPAIEWQAQDFQARTEIQCEVTTDATDLDLDQSQSTAMFRILQEALTNVARHAGGTRVNIVLRQDAGHLTLRVQDNGRGITAAEIGNRRSLGLLGMRERTRLLGGQLSIGGQPGEGTTVEAWIPFERPAGQREPAEWDDGHANAGGAGR